MEDLQQPVDVPPNAPDPFRTRVANPAPTGQQLALVRAELSYSAEDHTLRHGGLCLQLGKFIIVTFGRADDREKSLTKLADAAKQATELALDFRRAQDEDKSAFIWTVHAWCIKVSKYFQLHHFDSNEALFLLRTAMPTTADPLFQQAMENQPTLGEFLVSISEHYLNARILRQILLQATTIKQRKGQGFAEYVTFCRERMNAAIGKESTAALIRLAFEGIEQQYLESHDGVLEALRNTFLFIETPEEDLTVDQRRACTFAGLMRLIMSVRYNTRLGSGSTHRKDGDGDRKPDKTGDGSAKDNKGKSDKDGKRGKGPRRDKKARSDDNSESAPTKERKCFACGRTNHLIGECRDKKAVERYNEEKVQKQCSNGSSRKGTYSNNNNNNSNHGDKSSRVARNVEAALRRHPEVAARVQQAVITAAQRKQAMPATNPTQTLTLLPANPHTAMQVTSHVALDDGFLSIFSVSVKAPGGKSMDLASQPIGRGGTRMHAPELRDRTYSEIATEDFQFTPTSPLLEPPTVPTVIGMTALEPQELDTGTVGVDRHDVFSAKAGEEKHTQRARGTLQVFTTFNGQPTVVLYDTAAEIPICPLTHRETFAMRDEEASPHTVTGIEGGRLTASGTASAEIQMGTEVRTVVFHLVDSASVKTPLIPLYELYQVGLIIPRDPSCGTITLGGQEHFLGDNGVYFPTALQVNPTSEDVEGGPADEGLENISRIFAANTVLEGIRTARWNLMSWTY